MGEKSWEVEKNYKKWDIKEPQCWDNFVGFPGGSNGGIGGGDNLDDNELFGDGLNGPFTAEDNSDLFGGGGVGGGGATDGGAIFGGSGGIFGGIDPTFGEGELFLNFFCRRPNCHLKVSEWRHSGR